LNELPQALPFVALKSQKLEAYPAFTSTADDRGIDDHRICLVRDAQSDFHDARQRERFIGSYGATANRDVDRRAVVIRLISRQADREIDAYPLVFALIFIDSDILHAGLK
jgi:hypothetical protein